MIGTDPLRVKKKRSLRVDLSAGGSLFVCLSAIFPKVGMLLLVLMILLSF